MKQRNSRNFLLALLFMGLSANLAMASNVLVNSSNNQVMDATALKSILIGKTKFWADGSSILIIVEKGNADAEQKLSELTGMNASKFKNHWQRLAFSGRGKMPKLIQDHSEIIDLVKGNSGAIAISTTGNGVEGVMIATY